MQPINLVKPIKNVYASVLLMVAISAGALSGMMAYAQNPADPATNPAPDPAAEPATADAEATQSSSSSSEVPLYPSRNMRDKTLIANEAGEQAQWLDTEYGQLLAFYRPTEFKETHGVLVLFHSAEDPQSWPPILENLRANLPRYGWETLAITLPQKYPAPVPERASSASASSAADTNNADTTQQEPASPGSESSASSSSQSSSSVSSVVARETLIQAYVEAGFKFLQEKGQLNAVLLADNSSANLVLQQLLPQLKENNKDPDKFDGPIQALVITNLQSQEPLNTSELSAIFSNRKLPVLDVFFNPDSAEQKQSKDLHRAVAMRQKVDVYQQASLDSQPKIVETDPRSFLAARVRGFMLKYADGAEKKKYDEDGNRDKNTAR